MQPISMTRCPFALSRPVVSVSRTICLIGPVSSGLPWACAREDRGTRGRVDAIVLGVAGMAPHPAPVDPMAPRECIQFFPELAVRDRLLRGILPAVRLPARHPL